MTNKEVMDYWVSWYRTERAMHPTDPMTTRETAIGRMIDMLNESDGAYEKGLKDAWECARKILFDNTLKSDLLQWFGVDTFSGIIEKIPVEEVMDRLKKYEQSMCIQKGDEVTNEFHGNAICIRVREGYIDILQPDKYMMGVPKNEWRRTGRHFSQYDEIMQTLRGGENDGN